MQIGMEMARKRDGSPLFTIDGKGAALFPTRGQVTTATHWATPGPAALETVQLAIPKANMPNHLEASAIIV